MVDFVASLQKGIDLAEQAEINFKEIDSVFDDLNVQLKNAYDGEINIRRCPVFKNLRITMHNLSNNYIDYGDAVLAVYNTSTKNDTNLAQWQQSNHGYPCTIVFSDKKYICEDKESLENCFVDLLSEPLIANKIIKILNKN